VIALAGACRDKEPEAVVRSVVLHVPQSCPFPVDPSVYGILDARGDYEPQADELTTESYKLVDVGAALTNLPRDTRALIAQVGAGDFYWQGYAEPPSDGAIDILLWRAGNACSLSKDLGKRVAPAFGVFDARHALIAGGSPVPGGTVPDSFVADLSTGIITQLKNGLLTPRAGATVTAFGDGGALVAGGRSIDTGTPLGTAEVFAPADGATRGDFDGRPIALSVPRADHGAVAMASGDTLLVGGVGVDGKPLRSLEIVRPGSTRGLTAGLAQLEQARSKPSVLRLASGEILVGGGVQENGQPADRIEFFAPDARAVSRKSEVYRPGREMAFVPLPAGGALMVNAGELAPTITTAYVISADGVVEATPANVPGSTDRLALFRGAGGAPVLFTGNRWLVWQPWNGVFGPLNEALTAEGPPGAISASADTGLAIWLTQEGSHLAGLRFDTKIGDYKNVPHPMLLDGVVGLAPDRMIDLRQNDQQRIRFNKQSGLTLESGASAFVVDATFASFTLEAEIPGTPPLVVLREASGAELEIGGPNCRIEVPVGTASRIRVDRDAEIVRVTIDDREPTECTRRVSKGRLSIGLRGVAGSGRSAVKNLLVTRR
jgi:hypothetical protein